MLFVSLGDDKRLLHLLLVVAQLHQRLHILLVQLACSDAALALKIKLLFLLLDFAFRQERNAHFSMSHVELVGG